MYPFLKGLRVIECASFIAAPSCALHLQQLGAEVIRIDPIGGGPDFKRWPVSSSGASLYWEGLNKGKQSVALDLSRAEGRQLAIDLITAPGANAGIFVTNFPVGGFLAHEALCKQRADLITVRVMGWGDGTSAVDYTVNAAIGVPYMTGDEVNAERPVNHVLPAWDLLTGAYAAFATLAAERQRNLTGQGQEVRIPLSDVAMAALGNTGQIAEALHSGDRARQGNALFGAFGRDFVTADDQYLMVVAITAKQWKGLLNALQLKQRIEQLEGVLGVSFERDEGQRFIHRDALFPIFERCIAELTLEQVTARFAANDLCWSPYRTLGEAMQVDPRLALSSPLYTQLTHPSGLTYPAPGAAATFVGTPRDAGVRAPYLGENTDQVLEQVLSLTSAQIAQLHDSGLVAGSRHG